MTEYNTVIGPNTSFIGKVKISSPFLIEGRYEGTIDSDSDIVVGEKGFLKGEIKCKNLTVYGITEGTVLCSDSMTIIPKGAFSGEITAKNLCMQQGSIFAGSMKILSEKSVW